jgi:hypothetical protein
VPKLDFLVTGTAFAKIVVTISQNKKHLTLAVWKIPPRRELERESSVEHGEQI